MYSILTTVILLSVIFTTSLAASNLTVPFDHPLIQYEGRAGPVPLCRRDPNGTLLPGEPGCWLIEPKCTYGVAMGTTKASAASLKFKAGSAIYINSALRFVSSLYSITLDGKSVEVDGSRHPPAGGYVCDTIFSQTGLDPNVEHEIRLSIKGPSPTINLTAFPAAADSFEFSLINFLITTDNTSSVLPPILPKSSGSKMGISRLTTLLSLALLAFH